MFVNNFLVLIQVRLSPNFASHILGHGMRWLNFGRSKVKVGMRSTECPSSVLVYFVADACLLSLCLFGFFSTKPRDCLGRSSSMWPILCREGCKTLTESVLYALVFCISLAACLTCSVYLFYANWSLRMGPGYPLSAFAPPLSIPFLVFCSLLLFLFSFSHSLYLFSSNVHLIPFYLNRPTPFTYLLSYSNCDVFSRTSLKSCTATELQLTHCMNKRRVLVNRSAASWCCLAQSVK